jgi:hypothetical protein
MHFISLEMFQNAPSFFVHKIPVSETNLILGEIILDLVVSFMD